MRMQNGTTYDNACARVAAYHLATCQEPPAHPARGAAYALITGIYRGIVEDAARYGLNPAPDLTFGAWEQQRDRQKDVKIIRDTGKRIESLPAELFALVTTAAREGDRLIWTGAKPGRLLLTALSLHGAAVDKTGVTLPAGCVEGLTELAEISRAHTVPITDGPLPDKAYLFFSRCVFEPEQNWVAAAFDRAMDAGGRLLALCAALEARGYTRIDCRDGKRVSLDYVRTVGKKDAPIKASWADKVHAGIELSYEDLRLEPYFFWLRMPAYRDILGRAGALPEDVRAFLAAHTKTCDGCRYCVQTDKTHTRPLAAVTVNGTKKCPLFPSFSMNWRQVPPALWDTALRVLDTLYGQQA